MTEENTQTGTSLQLAFVHIGVVGSTRGWRPKGRQQYWPFKHRPAWISVSMQYSRQEPLGRSQTSLNLPTAAQRRGLL